MPPTNPSRRPLHSHSSPNARPESPQIPLAKLSPPLLPFTQPSPLRLFPRLLPHSPPLSTPELIPSTLRDIDTEPFPHTPPTPVLSSIPDQESTVPFETSYTLPAELQNHEASDPYDYALQNLVEDSPVSISEHTQPKCPLLLAHDAKDDQRLTSNIYSSHFPPGYVLNAQFFRQYMPGTEIGVGAFGFVVTATHRVQGYEVAVKFIERRKVPPWGWCRDQELGHVPTEVMLLKTLDHPGIVNFLDFFHDETYVYLVQELHGSPWCRKFRVHTNCVYQSLSAPTTLGSAIPIRHFTAASFELTQTAEKICGRQNVNSSFDSVYSQTGLCEYPFHHAPYSSSLSSPYMSAPSVAHTLMSSRSEAGLWGKIDGHFSRDLFECIEQHRRLPESQARHIFAQVVDVIQYLHTLGVAHRDIKDENILIDREFRVKVIDFGSASWVDPNRPGPRPWYRQFRGTIAHAPAEIIRGAQMHQAEPADIWALGILLACLICGRRPFATAEDAAEGRFTLYRCTVREEAEPLSQCQKTNTVSSECCDLLKRCLDPDPSTRAGITEVQTHPWLRGPTL